MSAPLARLVATLGLLGVLLGSGPLNALRRGLGPEEEACCCAEDDDCCAVPAATSCCSEKEAPAAATVRITAGCGCGHGGEPGWLSLRDLGRYRPEGALRAGPPDVLARVRRAPVVAPNTLQRLGPEPPPPRPPAPQRSVTAHPADSRSLPRAV